MLQSLLPKAHHKFRALPLLGPIADGFDDWLAAKRLYAGIAKVLDPFSERRRYGFAEARSPRDRQTFPADPV